MQYPWLVPSEAHKATGTASSARARLQRTQKPDARILAVPATQRFAACIDWIGCDCIMDAMRAWAVAANGTALGCALHSQPGVSVALRGAKERGVAWSAQKRAAAVWYPPRARIPMSC